MILRRRITIPLNVGSVSVTEAVPSALVAAITVAWEQDIRALVVNRTSASITLSMCVLMLPIKEPADGSWILLRQKIHIDLTLEHQRSRVALLVKIIYEG